MININSVSHREADICINMIINTERMSPPNMCKYAHSQMIWMRSKPNLLPLKYVFVDLHDFYLFLPKSDKFGYFIIFFMLNTCIYFTIIVIKLWNKRK